MNQWWVYLHVNGTLHAKRYFDAIDIQEAKSSDFVQRVFGPFDAEDREDALRKASKILNRNGRRK